MPKDMMQLIYEWSMRTADPEKYQKIEFDKDKIEWLRKAWDEIFVSGADMLRGYLGVICDPQSQLDERELVCEELAELVENIDNAMTLGKLKGWS